MTGTRRAAAHLSLEGTPKREYRSAAKARQDTIRIGMAGFGVYPCRWGDHWHIGHKKPAEIVRETA